MCHKKHPVKILCFTPRKIPQKNGSFKDSFAVRIICKIKKGTGDQYTTTLLPQFLHPYSRRLADDIIKAADSYIKGTSKDYQQAAMEMNAESGKTFKRYWDRILERISKWQLIIATHIAKLDHSPSLKRTDINQKEIWKQWNYWNELLDEYWIQHCRYGNIKLNTRNDVIRFCLMKCAQKGCGLGP